MSAFSLRWIEIRVRAEMYKQEIKGIETAGPCSQLVAPKRGTVAVRTRRMCSSAMSGGGNKKLSSRKPLSLGSAPFCRRSMPGTGYTIKRSKRERHRVVLIRTLFET